MGEAVNRLRISPLYSTHWGRELSIDEFPEALPWVTLLRAAVCAPRVWVSVIHWTNRESRDRGSITLLRVTGARPGFEEDEAVYALGFKRYLLQPVDSTGVYAPTFECLVRVISSSKSCVSFKPYLQYLLNPCCRTLL